MAQSGEYFAHQFCAHCWYNGTFNSSLRVFLGCNFAISLLSRIRFLVALSTVFGLLFSYKNAYHNICGTSVNNAKSEAWISYEDDNALSGALFGDFKNV